MTMSTGDLAPLFNPEKGSVVRYGAGKVHSWNADGFANQIEFNGTVISDFSVYGGINALTIQPDDEVALLGYESPGGISTWFVLGRIIPPGEDASDLVMRGGVLTLDGATFRMITSDDVEIIYVGNVVQGDVTSRGWIFRFDTGNNAFTLSGVPGNQFWSLYDSNETRVVTNDAVTGVGLGRPYIPLRMVPSAAAQISGTSFWPSHTSTSFIQLMNGINPVFHPRVQIGVGAVPSGGGSAQWRLVINGTDATGTITGGGTETVSIPGWGTSVLPGDTVDFELQARIAGGGTRVFIQCDKFYALQS